jgi:N-succinyldiaminopimelate aminotransferase
MNPDLNKLQPYPFEKLSTLMAGTMPDKSLPHIAWSIGEPKHEPPAFALKTFGDEIQRFRQYPSTKGILELRQAISDWATGRFSLTKDTLTAEHHILPVNGTREALFAFAQTVIDRDRNPLVLMPNPFYQIYEGAAFLAGAEPLYLNCLQANDYQLDLDAITEQQWIRCQLIFICSPNNPTGSIISKDDFKKLIALADKYDFIIASDECYSEIYMSDEHTPSGLLEVCAELGRNDYSRCIVFHSLSKRSNLPGMRSGFVAGEASIIKSFFSYRTYHGCAMPIPAQLASIAAWQDEKHVIKNRLQYQQKFALVESILKDSWPLIKPQAGFNFWAKTPIDDELFCRQLFEQQHITVLPGSYLSREVNGINPGKHHVRMALVASIEECEQAAYRIKEFVSTL